MTFQPTIPELDYEKGRPSHIESADPVHTESVRDAFDSDESEEARVHIRTVVSILAINFIYFAQLVNIVGAGAQAQTITARFNSDSNDSVWLLGSITILAVSLGPIVSQAADYWGRKWLLLVLNICGALGAFIVANAQSWPMLVGGFMTLGIMYGTQPLLHAITSEVIPRRWRGWGQAVNGVSNYLGSAVALIGGGALNRTNDPSSNGFRHFYYIVAGCLLLGVILSFFAYNPPKTERQCLPLREKLAKLDFVGYFLLSSGLTLFCVALSLSQNPYPWSDPHVSAVFAIGVALLLCLAVYETRFRKDGMFHDGLFTSAKNYNFAICLLCIFCEGAAFFAGNSYFAFQVGVLYEHDALLVGVRYTIMFIAAGVGAAFAGYWCARTRQTRWLTVFALVLFIVFFGCMASTNRTTNTPTWGYPVLMGLALGITLTTLVTVAQISTPPDLIALASGLMLSSRATGGAVGLACYHAIFVSDTKSLGDNIARAGIAAGLNPQNAGQFIGAITSESQEALQAVPGITPQIIQGGVVALLDTFARAFRDIWIAAGCLVALAAIVSVFLKDSEDEFNMHIDAPLEK